MSKHQYTSFSKVGSMVGSVWDQTKVENILINNLKFTSLLQIYKKVMKFLLIPCNMSKRVKRPLNTFEGGVGASMIHYIAIPRCLVSHIMVLARRASGCLFGHPNP